MARILNSFKIRSGKKILDYRLVEKLDLNKIESFFQRTYNIKKLWDGNRHVLGILTKNNVDYFLKLSTSEGISVVTKNECNWNNYFNKYFPKNFTFCVPKNYETGVYKNKYFYLITDYFHGKLLCETRNQYQNANSLIKYIPQVIKLSQVIQEMPGIEDSFKTRFINKVDQWYSDIPVNIRKKFKIQILWKIVEEGTDSLHSKVRHGDFAPWHIIKLQNEKLGLIDGEHFLTGGVEGYDICYFIQRVFSVLKNPLIAQHIYSKLLAKGYEKNKLKTVLAARAIGGFLDESLIEKSEYYFANKFKDWIIQL